MMSDKDQAGGLRDLARKGQDGDTGAGVRLPGSRGSRVIAVTSGKGGVGKSFLSGNLAITLSRFGKKVLLFDADMGLANLHIQFGLSPKLTLEHLVTGNRSVEEITLEGPGGIEFLPGGGGVEELANLDLLGRERIVSMLRRIETAYDYLVIDTGAGLSENVTRFLLASGRVIIVTTPDPAALADAYGVIKVVNRQNRGARINLLVNMARTSGEAEHAAQTLESFAARQMGIKIESLGFISYDQAVLDAVRGHQPIVLLDPSSKVTLTLREIVGRLLREDSEAHKDGGINKLIQGLEEVQGSKGR